jgi:hypothetical protein
MPRSTGGSWRGKRKGAIQLQPVFVLPKQFAMSGVLKQFACNICMKTLLAMTLIAGMLPFQPADAQTTNHEAGPVFGDDINETGLKLTIKKQWKDVNINLVSVGSSITPMKFIQTEVTGSEASYEITPFPTYGEPFFREYRILAIGIPKVNKNCILNAGANFYVLDTNGMTSFFVGSSIFWTDSYIQTQTTKTSVNDTIKTFEARCGAKTVNDKLLEIAPLGHRIMLREYIPHYFLSDGPAPGGMMVMPSVSIGEITNSIILLNVHNPRTDGTVQISFNFESKKIIRSVFNGKEMNINSGKPFAVPLTSN